MTDNRLEKLMESLPQGADAALITSEMNRMYYTEFKSSAGTLLVFRGAAYFITDFRYIEAARERIRGCEVLLLDKLMEQLAGLLEKHGARTVAVESDYVTLGEFERIQSALEGFSLLSGGELSALIRSQREIKSPRELDCMKQAQKITDDSFSYILNYIKPGRTEREIALELEFYSRRAGSQEAAFEFIVVSGKNGSLPHGVPTDKPVEKGELLTMDFGCTINGYRSDMTRTVAIGSADEERRLVYETVKRAGEEAQRAVKAGVICGDMDEIARAVIRDAGYGEYFGHSLGHSVGLDIHESPRFSPGAAEVCRAGTVMTIEPGIYIGGRFGCRIEDMVFVTPEGCENLTNSPRELVIV